MLDIFNWFGSKKSFKTEDQFDDSEVPFVLSVPSSSNKASLTPDDKVVQLNDTNHGFVNVDLRNLTYAEALTSQSGKFRIRKNSKDQILNEKDETVALSENESSESTDDVETDDVNNELITGSIINAIDLDKSSALREVNFNDKLQRDLKKSFRRKNKRKNKKFLTPSN